MPTRARVSDWLAALSHGFYVLSLVLPALRPGGGPEVWTGIECLIFAFPFGFLFHPAPWANLTFAVGAYALARGYAAFAAVMAAASMMLAGFTVISGPDIFPALLPGYWTWVGAMGTLLVAAMIYPSNAGTGQQGESRPADPPPNNVQPPA